MRRRLLRLFVALLVMSFIAAVGLGAAVSVLGYDVVSRVNRPPACERGARGPTPSAFLFDGIDTHPYLMRQFESITFLSRDDGYEIAALYVSSYDIPETEARTVILTHGVSACKRIPMILLAAGMLHRQGYNVLILDLREHGDSQDEDGRHAGGAEEYRDVLGAFDWLTTARDIPASSIGLFGISLGGATSLIAFGEEPRIGALWADSPFADVRSLVSAEVAGLGLPTFLADTTLLVGRVRGAEDYDSRTPLLATANMAGRTVFIAHVTGDTLIPVDHAARLEVAVRDAGGSIETWIVEGGDHTASMALYPVEYETRLLAFFDAALPYERR